MAKLNINHKTLLCTENILTNFMYQQINLAYGFRQHIIQSSEFTHTVFSIYGYIDDIFSIT